MTTTAPAGFGAPAGWQPAFSPWRHGGWYVTNVRYPSGASGCVSRNYSDRQWRIIADDCGPGTPDDRSWPTRHEAARAEYRAAAYACLLKLTELAGGLYPAVPGDYANTVKPQPNRYACSCAACGFGLAEAAGWEVLSSRMTSVVFLHQGCAGKVHARQLELRG